MYIISAAIIVLILIIFYLEKNPAKKNSAEPVKTVSAETFRNADISEKSYNDVAAKIGLDDSVTDSHREYIATTRQFSSGANYTSVADDNNTSLFNNFLGHSRPRYVEILPGARQVPDVDSSVFKRNKHQIFVNDQL
jgi:ABC-type dipeptide/oligopeptide/nickel transport system permease component